MYRGEIDTVYGLLLQCTVYRGKIDAVYCLCSTKCCRQFKVYSQCLQSTTPVTDLNTTNIYRSVISSLGNLCSIG